MTRYTNPVPQIQDDDGKPIVGAKKYFFETNSSTLKTIYSDDALTLPIDNPVLSDSGGRFPGIFLDGIYREVQHDDQGVLMWDEDPIGELPSGQAQLWSVSTTYNIPEVVYGSDDEYYRSLTDTNIGNNPTTSAAAWELVKFIQVWNTNVTYILNQHAYGSDGDLYVSLEASNFGNDPTGAGGKWEYVSVDNKWTDIASATTTDLGAAKGHSGNITGTATITSFGTIKEGTRKTATFTGSLTLTYNATSLILPGNTNIITQAGDVAEFISLGSGNWICTKYQIDSVSPLIKPSFSVTRNGSDQTNITGLDKIEWTTAIFDTNSDFDVSTNFRHTPTVAGKYLYTCNAALTGATTTAGDPIQLYIYKNGTVYNSTSFVHGGAQNETTQITSILDVNGSTDYVEIFMSNAGRDTSTLLGSSTYTFFTGCKID